MTDITVRFLEFDMEEAERNFDAEFMPGDPEMSYWLVGLSMILPYLEPYLVKHSLAGQKVVRDQEIKHDMRQFAQQEAQHFTQHGKFNDLVRKHYPELIELEKQAKADYDRFSAKGLKYNLAFAEGFESLTHPFVIYMWQSGIADAMTGPLGDMYRWHFMEEMEHRTVAYDAYYTLYDSYWYRLRVSLVAQIHLITFMTKVARVMLKKERHLFEQRGGWKGRISRVWKWTTLAGKYLIPQLWKSYLPGYNPRNLIVPPELEALDQEYNERSYKLIGPTPVAA